MRHVLTSYASFLYLIPFFSEISFLVRSISKPSFLSFRVSKFPAVLLHGVDEWRRNVEVWQTAQRHTLLTTVYASSKVQENEVQCWSWRCTYDYSLLCRGVRDRLQSYLIFISSLPFRFECAREPILGV